MKEFLPVLINSPLFKGIEPRHICAMLSCLDARQVQYEKGATLYSLGEPVKEMGLVLTGSISLEKEDYWGNRSILARVYPSQVFGEVYACLNQEPATINVIAAQESQVLFLDVSRLSTTCTSACPFHTVLIQNLMAVLAQKAYQLTQKIHCLSSRTLRQKLMAYLSEQSQLAKNSSFTIPFNRQELADYLCADRSALSAELGRLSREGLLSFHKNEFTLYYLKD